MPPTVARALPLLEPHWASKRHPGTNVEHRITIPAKGTTYYGEHRFQIMLGPSPGVNLDPEPHPPSTRTIPTVARIGARVDQTSMEHT